MSSIIPAYAGTGLRRKSLINSRTFWNSFLGIATSGSWKVIYGIRPLCRGIVERCVER
jgi:hypothetical protein